MNVLFFNFIVFFFIMSPVLAMEDEEAPKHIQAIFPILSQQKAADEDALPLSIVPIESIPDELLLTVFKFLEVPDLGRTTQVSKHFQKLAEDSGVWKHTGLKYYGDYLSEEGLKENPKQKVISHYLSVIVNETENLEKIKRLINYYQLHLYAPFFKQYVKPIFLTGLETNLPNSKEFIVQTTPEIIWQKIDQLCAYSGSYSEFGLSERLLAALELNEFLVERGDQKAIERKIKGLTSDKVKVRVFVPPTLNLFGQVTWEDRYFPLYGYVKNEEAAREFIELLVEAGNPTGIESKIEGLAEGKYGYKQDLEALKEFNDLLVENRNMKAITRKFKGLAEAKYGYEKDPAAAREFDEFLVERGDPEAIVRKIWCLTK